MEQNNLEKAFVNKHLHNVLRQRGLMISSKDGTDKVIKQILIKYYLNLANKIEYVVKEIAKKTIVTPGMVQTAYSMC